MRLVRRDKAIEISETEAVAFCGDNTVPVAANREAGEPASEGECDTPESYGDEKTDTNPSHVSGLEDAEVLEEKSDLDNGAVGDVYG